MDKVKQKKKLLDIAKDDIYYDSEDEVEQQKELNQSTQPMLNPNKEIDNAINAHGPINEEHLNIQDQFQSCKLEEISEEYMYIEEDGANPKNTGLDEKTKGVPLVYKAISKETNRQTKKRGNHHKERRKQTQIGDGGNNHDDEKPLKRADKLTNDEYIMLIGRMQDYINDAFSDDLIKDLSQLVSQQIFELKYSITPDNIKVFCAFLLSTGQIKMISISDYFSNSLLNISSIFSKDLFTFITSTLKDDQILNKFQTLISQHLFNQKIKPNKISLLKQHYEQYSKLIISNYLDFFDDYQFDFENKSILLNQPTRDQKKYSHDIYKPTDSTEQNYFTETEKLNFLIKDIKGELKASVKKFLDFKLSQNPIFSQPKNLQPHNDSLPNYLFEKELQKQHLNEPNPQQTESFPKFTFLYLPTTLQLISIQQENKIQHGMNYNQESDSQAKTSTQEVLQIESQNLNPTKIQKFLFKNHVEGSIDTELNKQIQLIQFIFFIEILILIPPFKLIRVFINYRPLTKINLEEFECLGLRALSEMIYSLSIEIFTKLIYKDCEHLIGHPSFIQNNIADRLFKDLLNQIIKYLLSPNKMSSQQSQQIPLLSPNKNSSQAQQQPLFSPRKKSQQQPQGQPIQSFTKDYENCENQGIQIEMLIKRHFLEKKQHCNFCLVCKFNHDNLEKKQSKEVNEMSSEDLKKKKKSKYQCIQCTEYYGKSISVCVERCDQLFHENPLKYVRGKLKLDRNKSRKKIDTAVKSIPNISVSEQLDQLDTVQKVFDSIVDKIYFEGVLGLQSIKDYNEQRTVNRNIKFKEMNQCPQEMQLNDAIERINVHMPPLQIYQLPENEIKKNNFTSKDHNKQDNIFRKYKNDSSIHI